MNTIILLAGRESLDIAFKEVGAQNYIDHQISQFLKMNFEVFVVVDKVSADKVIRGSKKLDQCELIYDTHSQPYFFSNFRAALYATYHMSLIHPLHHPIPTTKNLKKLLNTFYKFGTRTNYHLIQGHSIQSGQIQTHFPVLITPRGNHFLRMNKSVSDLKVLKSHTYNCFFSSNTSTLHRTKAHPLTQANI